MNHPGGLRVAGAVAIALAIAGVACGNSASSAQADGDAGMDGRASDAATDATESGGPFAVASLPGLVLWVDASKDVTQTDGGPDGGLSITMWKDQSKLGNDLTPFNDANACLLKTGVVNGHDAVTCVNFGLQNMAPRGFDFGTDSFLIAAVMVVAGPHLGFTGEDTIGAFGLSTTGLTEIAPTAAIFSGGAADQAVGPMAPPGVHLLEGVRRGGTLTLRIDGADVASDTTFDAGRSFATTNIRAATYRGVVAEVVVTHGEPTASDMGALERYFKMRYGL